MTFADRSDRKRPDCNEKNGGKYGWFVGTVINEDGGTLEIKSDFLDPSTRYDVTYYEDAEDTHYQENKESYRIRKGKLRKGDIVRVEMAPGGGHSMWIRPE